MERKDFIKTSSLMLGGLSIFPMMVNALNLHKNKVLELIENKHIRHGYYGKEFTLNHLSGKVLTSVRIDRFLHPDGDMLLVDCSTSHGDLRLSVSPETIMYEFNNDIAEIGSNESVSILANKLQLFANPKSQEIKGHTFIEALLISGDDYHCQVVQDLEIIQEQKDLKLICLFL